MDCLWVRGYRFTPPPALDRSISHNVKKEVTRGDL